MVNLHGEYSGHPGEYRFLVPDLGYMVEVNIDYRNNAQNSEMKSMYQQYDSNVMAEVWWTQRGLETLIER